MDDPAKSNAVRMRITIEKPVADVMHSLQSKDGLPLAPKVSRSGEPLSFDFPVRAAPGPRFTGEQVRREGPERRFVYICVGQLAGDLSSPWSRRMKIDIHHIGQELVGRAADSGSILQITIDGTGKDGTPACATVSPMAISMEAE